MFNESRFAEALGNQLGLFVFGLKGVNQIQHHQIGHFDFQWHGAAIGCTGVAHTRFVARPSVGPVDVDDADGRFHEALFTYYLNL